MKQQTMKFIWLFLMPIALYGLYVVFVLIFGTLNDYQPEELIKIEVINNQELIASDSSQFNLMIWNIGYSGLGAKSDFFLDGGSMVRTDKLLSQAYLDGIKSTISAQKNLDFILLQEVDIKAKRSYKVNQFESIAEDLGTYSRSHALNFNVKFVPKPLTSLSPIGQVQSGLASYSRYKVTQANRYQFPGSYDWPTSAFHLDRCFLESRIPLESGKELVLINSHNSAYDGGKLKPLEMAYLKEHLLLEYDKGNYVLVGADWNQCPPNFAYDSFASENADDYYQDNIPEDFMPLGWNWVYDANTPSNRKLSASYEEGKTFTTLIDFYLVSPNIQVIAVEGLDLSFKYSDHQPVKLTIQLR